MLKDIAKALDVELVALISDNNNAIYIDFCGYPLGITYKKLEVLSADENFEKDILNDILSKKDMSLIFLNNPC